VAGFMSDEELAAALTRASRGAPEVDFVVCDRDHVL
jgi:hypothetical protein